MASAPKYIPNYTVSDYQCWEGNWELLNGIPIAMGPSPFGRHQNLISVFIGLAWPQLENCSSSFRVLAEIDWIVDEHTVVRPDVVIVAGGVPEKHVESRPELVMEILSDSTAHRDREVKKQLYEACQVPFYLIADCTEKSIEIYQLQSETYQLQPKLDFIKLNLSEACQIEIPVKTLFE